MSQGRPLIVPGMQASQCRHRSRQTRIAVAYLDGEPAVAIFQGDRLRLVLTREDAYAIADLIVDTLETAPPFDRKWDRI